MFDCYQVDVQYCANPKSTCDLVTCSRSCLALTISDFSFPRGNSHRTKVLTSRSVPESGIVDLSFVLYFKYPSYSKVS